MNRPQITLSDAIIAAITHSNIENDEPCCVRAVYMNGYFDLAVYTLYQKYDFYVDAFSGEVSGIMSEPLDSCEAVFEELCA